MGRLLLASGAALFLIGEVSANAPPPQPKPTTKSTAPKLGAEPATVSPSGNSTILIGTAMGFALASDGLYAFRRQSK